MSAKVALGRLEGHDWQVQVTTGQGHRDTDYDVGSGGSGVAG